MADISVLNFGDGVNRNIKDVTSRVLLPATVGWTGKNELENTASTTTYGDLTFTVNSDGSVTVNGTNGNSDTSLVIFEDNNNSCPFNGYKLNGCPAGGSSTTFDLRLSDVTAGSCIDTGAGNTISLSNTGKWKASILIRANQNINNLTFYPMIYSSAITDPTYEPHHKSVEECLEEINDKLSYLETTATLSTSGTTTVTFSNAKITTNSCVDIGVSVWGIVPEDVTVASGSCTIVMPKVDSAQTVTVRLYVR